MTNPPVGRFAPSPTGPLHAGSLVAALGSWLFAKAAGGRWLVRVEDLDAPRVAAGMEADILRTLEALGLEWDGDVAHQSERLALYRDSFERLKAGGYLYPCGCTRRELSLAPSAPHAGEEGPPYPGTCRGGLPPGREVRAWRVAAAGERAFRFDDLVLGRQSLTINGVGGDFVVKRADGFYAYQLAVVVDDAEQGVSQVVRGCDLLTSTPRQLLLQEYLQLPTPVYGHLPVVTNADGGKLSKRENAVSLASGINLEREGGRLICNALAFLGQNPPSDLYNATGGEALNWGKANFRPGEIGERSGGNPAA